MTAPIPSQTDVTIQNAVDGSVDYLKFSGSTLTGSSNFNYGLGTDLKVVGSLGNVLVTQSQSTGLVDFLTLNANGSLQSTALSNVAVAPIVGNAFFELGDVLVSQGPSGLDFERFNPATGQLTATDLVPGTANLPKVVGVASGDFPGVTTDDTTAVTQLANGEVDLVGFSGGFGSLSVVGTDLLSQTIGLPSVSAVNQRVDNLNVGFGGSGESLQLIGTVGGPQADAMYVNSGFNDPSHEGVLAGTNLLNLQFPNYNVVDAAGIAASIFPGA